MGDARRSAAERDDIERAGEQAGEQAGERTGERTRRWAALLTALRVGIACAGTLGIGLGTGLSAGLGTGLGVGLGIGFGVGWALGLDAAPANAQIPDVPAGPLDVEQLVRLALDGNHNLAQAEQNVAAFRGSRLGAWSGLLPNAFASADYNRTTARFPTIDPNTGRLISSTTSEYYSLSVRGNANIVDLPSWFALRAAGHSLAAARAGYQDARQDLALAVRQQYYLLIRSRQLARVAEEAFTLRQEQLRRAQALFDLGSVARSDVLQAQVNLATAERDRISTGNSVEQDQARLALLVALPADYPLDVAEPPSVDPLPAEPPEAELVERALRSRPDLAQAEANLAAASASERRNRAARLPSLGGGYFYNKTEEDLGDLARSVDRNARWGFNVGFSLLIFDGLRHEGAVQQATADRRAREEALEQARLNVGIDVRESLLEIRSATEGIRSAREAVGLAEESVRLQRALYESGAGTLLEWNNAQVELTRAQVALVDAEVGLRLARARLENATGENVP